MAEPLQEQTLRLYRRFRFDHSPELALVVLRNNVRTAREYAIVSGRITLAAELGDEDSTLTCWLENVRLLARRDTPRGRFWRTGRFKGPLRFTVAPTGDNRSAFDPITCESAGCAIKHALSVLQRPDVFEVLITDTWTDEIRLVDVVTTMGHLNAMSWPVA